VPKSRLDFSEDVNQINSYLSNLKNQSPYDEEITELIDHILKKGGKRIRPLICLLSFEMISKQERNDISYAAACALEVIHNATLLVDDVFDKDIFRRKEKSFYLEFSTFAAISLSYSMSSLALSLATKTQVLEVVDELIKVLHTLSTSLFLEEKFRKGEKKMSKDEAIKLIDRKTSCLFEAASVIGVIIGDSTKEDRELMKNFGIYFGRAFQLRDDILSLLSSEEELGKSGVWTDITNRIQTFLVLKAFETTENSDREILEKYYLEKEDFSPTLIKDILIKSGSINSLKTKVTMYVEKAVSILEKFPQSLPRAKLIEITKSLEF
jgi:geranylgeranyl pyrophosphate synthase